MEYIQIVDKNGNFTGEIKEREEVHHKNLLHNEISIFIINDKNEVLLEKRSPNKKYSPNKWGLCGGHVSAYEGLEEAALREGKEELGLEISLNKLHPFGKREFILDQTNSYFIYSYYVKSNLKENEFILQKEEVSEVKWVNIDTIIEMILSHNESLTQTTSMLLSNFYQLKTVILKNGYVEMWNNWAKKRNGKPVYDLWLDEYQDILERNHTQEILDLGCGNGADTLYLKERGYQVLSCDFSKEALKNIKKTIPNTYVKYLNLLEPFKIEDNTYSLIIADLSLHYFDNETTIQIMKEIRRILKKDGILLARVASIHDFNFGAGVGEQLEKNFYFEGDYTKRFFDEEDIKKYFGIIGEIEYKETSMTREEEEYQKPKMLYQVKVRKSN